MAWSEPAFKARLLARAAELGRPLRALLAEAGIAHDTIDKVPASGRRIDTLERVAEALSWSLADVMGFNVLGRLSSDTAKKAFASARRVVARLPRRAQTDERLIEAFVHLYDVYAVHPDADEKAVEEMLVRAWEEGAAGPPKEP